MLNITMFNNGSILPIRIGRFLTQTIHNKAIVLNFFDY